MLKHISEFTFILLLGAAITFGGQKISPDLESADPSKDADIIVQFKTPPTDAHFKRFTDAGGKHKGTLNFIKGAAFGKIPHGQLKKLAADPDVAYISPDREVKGALDYASSTVGATTAYGQGWDGTGIGVAVIDSGVYTHPDLDTKTFSQASRVVYSQNFVVNQTATGDGYGHGTHVASVIAGSAKKSICSGCTAVLRGIAPNANIISLRALGNNGSGTDSAVIAAIQRAIALKSTYNIRVINLSLGRPVTESYKTDPLCQAVEAAWKAGIVVVVAAGNEGRNNKQGTAGYSTIASPGNDPYVITVGAMKTMATAARGDDVIASYSSKGPTLLDRIVKPDLVAPGNRIIAPEYNNATLWKSYPGNVVALSYYGGNTALSQYFRLSGTSMAAPMVSGAAALMLHKDPSLTPDQVKARLMKTATKTFPSSSIATGPATGVAYTSQYDIFTVGAGYLDVWAAMNDTTVVTGTAISPAVTRNAVTNAISLLYGSGVVWGTGVVWDSNVVWGTGGNLAGTGVVWGSSVVWGSGTPATESTAITINGEN
jgi:serine protease AprX